MTQRTFTTDDSCDKEWIRGAVSRFLSKWSDYEADRLLVKKCDPLVRGFSSQVFLVTSPEKEVVFLKKYTKLPGNPIRLTHQQQELVQVICGLKGISPKVIGVFADGRVDEFLDSRSLQWEDFQDPFIAGRVAKAYASFHSLDLPLDRNRQQVLDHKMISFFKSVKSDPEKKWINIMAEAGVDATPHLTHGFDDEILWLNQELGRLNSRKVWCHVDAHQLNILVHGTKGQESVSLVDFQYVAHQFRAFDLGCLFVGTMVLETNRDDRRDPGRDVYSDQKIRDFCAAYLKEWQSLNPESFDPAIDDVDHLVQESLLGSMLNLIWMIFICDANADKLIKHEPSFARASVWMFQVFLRQKELYSLRYAENRET